MSREAVAGQTPPSTSLTARARQINVRPLARPEHNVPVGDASEGAAVLKLVPESPARRKGSTSVFGEQQSLALEFTSPTPFVPVIVSDANRPSAIARPPATWDEEDREDSFFEPQPTSRSELPEPSQWARRYGQAWIEAFTGRRPVKQLTRWSSPGVLADLSRPAEATANRPALQLSGRPRRRSAHMLVSGIRVDEPADGVAEVAAVIRERGRCRALMMRLEGWDGRWVCTYAAIV